MRYIVVTMLAWGCGKQLNPDFCDAHPGDDRCLGSSNADGSGTKRDAAVDAGPLPACPSKYDITIMSQPRSKYLQINSIDDWDSAVAMCATDLPGHTHLVVIGSAIELTELEPYFDRKRFIGMSDQVTEGTFLPVTDEVVDFPALYNLQVPPWAVGQPNNTGDCVSIDNNLEAWDDDCTGALIDLEWLCECDDYANDPDNY